MYSTLQRLNNVTALATSVIMILLSLVSLTTLVLPARVEPSSLKLNHINVLFGRSNYDRTVRAREYAFAKFDVIADLSPMFNWNTKQIFVYLRADYQTGDYASRTGFALPANSVVLWDRIVRGKRFARINIADGKQKYEFKEITNSFKNVSAVFSLQYQVQPYVGLLMDGSLVQTEAIVLPPAQRRT
ncbi:Signal peptidase complex subunit [Microbotryomycetes sp. JL201]|nr:Signal peptidase complex subunit [Microbotryomycetes sp. JL201]